MTSLNDPVHQREIEEKKRGSGKRTVQIFKKKKKGMNMDQNTLLGVLIPFVGTTAVSYTHLRRDRYSDRPY